MTTISKVIVSNIGNRSLIYSGEGGPLKSIEAAATIKGKTLPKTGYRYDTDELLKLARIDSQILSALRINILDKLLNEKCQETSHLYLIVSDQVKENAQHIKQDTLYAGELIKLLIEQNEHYKHIEVTIITYKNSVVEADKLIPFYREELSKLLSKHKEQTFIICDSGGTPQQKTSLKISAEYLIPENHVEYYQIIEQVDGEGEIILGQSILNPQDNHEYRKIIDAQQIALLIDNGNYQAASYIQGSKGSLIHSVLLFNHYRLLLRDKDAIEIIRNTKNLLSPNEKKQSEYEIHKILVKRVTSRDSMFRHFQSIINFFRETPFDSYEQWNQYFNKNDFNKVCEILHAANFYWFATDVNDYSQGVLYYHIFMEQFLTAIISKHLSIANNFETEFKSKTNNQYANVGTYATYLLTVSNFANDTKIADLLSDFKNCHSRSNGSNGSKGLNELRNQIAHQGKGIKNVSEVNAHVPYFENMIKRWREALGLSVIDENIYLQTNKEIKEYLKLS